MLSRDFVFFFSKESMVKITRKRNNFLDVSIIFIRFLFCQIHRFDDDTELISLIFFNVSVFKI